MDCQIKQIVPKNCLFCQRLMVKDCLWVQFSFGGPFKAIISRATTPPTQWGQILIKIKLNLRNEITNNFFKYDENAIRI